MAFRKNNESQGYSEVQPLKQEIKVLRQEVRYLKELLENSTKDAMTGLGSRNTFVNEFPKILSGAFRIGCELTLVVIDLDDLKKTNDAHGHLAGDALIKAAAKSISESLRTEDFSYRYGGDEFLILAYSSGENSAESMLRRLARTMHKNGVRYSAGFSNTSQFAESMPRKKITEGNTALLRDMLIKAADEMMYSKKHAKKAGKRD